MNMLRLYSRHSRTCRSSHDVVACLCLGHGSTSTSMVVVQTVITSVWRLISQALHTNTRVRAGFAVSAQGIATMAQLVSALGGTGASSLGTFMSAFVKPLADDRKLAYELQVWKILVALVCHVYLTLRHLFAFTVVRHLQCTCE
jgi:hypothetical protein